MLLRYLSARVQMRGFYADDGFALAAYVGMLAQAGLAIWGIVHGSGNPMTDMTMDDLHVQAQLVVSVATTWVFSTTAIRLAILWLYTRIFATKTFRRISMSIMAVNSVFGITSLVIFLSRCHPVSQEWDPKPWGSCRPLATSEFATSCLNLALDFMIVVLPMPWLWRLHMPMSNKIVVTIMFSFGFATISIILYRITRTVGSSVNPDPIIAESEIGLLSCLEIWLGIVVACMPTLAPVLRAYVKPSLVKLSRRLYGSSNPPKDKQTPRVALRTFGGSGPPPSYDQTSRNHYKSSGKYSHIGTGSEDLGLVTNQMSYLQTHCAGGNANAQFQHGGIHVQKQFHTVGV